MTIEEIENDLNRGIYLNNYSNVEQAISFLLSEIKRLRELYLDADNDRYTESHKRMAREAEVKRLREGIEKIYEYISPTDTPEIYKKVIELLESK